MPACRKVASWKTTSSGMTWFPVFDSVTEVDSIGAISAPSDPNAPFMPEVATP